MNTILFNELTNLLANDWEMVKINNNIIKDSRIDRFKRLPFDKMDSVIEDLQMLLEEFKTIRKEKLEKEILETEEKLKKLKGI